METRTGSRIASVILSFILALGLAGCSSGGSSGSADDFVGSWVLEDMVGTDAPDADEVALIKELAGGITLALASDGDAYFELLGEGLWGTWSYKSENEATMTAEGEKIPLALEGGKLKIEQDDSAMIFAKTDDPVIIPVKPESDDWEMETEDEDEYIDFDETEDSAEDADDDFDFDFDVVYAELGETFGNEYATFTITSVEEDWSGDASYSIEISNEWDEPITTGTVSGTFSVGGKMVDPTLSETIQPGKYVEATMWFSSDDVPDVDSLVDVEGVIHIMDEEWNTLSEIMVYFPSAD